MRKIFWWSCGALGGMTAIPESNRTDKDSSRLDP